MCKSLSLARFPGLYLGELPAFTCARQHRKGQANFEKDECDQGLYEELTGHPQFAPDLKVLRSRRDRMLPLLGDESSAEDVVALIGSRLVSKLEERAGVDFKKIETYRNMQLVSKSFKSGE